VFGQEILPTLKRPDQRLNANIDRSHTVEHRSSGAVEGQTFVRFVDVIDRVRESLRNSLAKRVPFFE